MNWVDFVGQVATLLDTVGSAEEVIPNVEDVDFNVLKRCGVFEGRRNGMVEGNALDKR